MLLAVALLAAVTGASNHASTGRDGSAQDLAVGLAATLDDVPAAAKAADQGARPAAVGSGVTTTTAAGASQPTTTAPGPAGAAGAAGDSTAGATADEEGEAAGEVAEEDAEAEDEPVPARVRTVPTPVPVVPPAPAPAPVPVGLTRQSNVELEVLTLTNMDRGNNGVPPIARNSCMDAEASAWAHAMADSTTMAHSDGAAAAVQGCRGSNAYWGDNIGYWDPCLAGEMEAWWMNSPSHRPHILDANYTVVGIGVWAEPSGRCWFQVYFGS
jgi:uncharacterized protein YkwD